MPVRHLPDHPDLDQLRHQAKDLLRALKHGDAEAAREFRAHGIEPADATLAAAQLVLARSYQAPSWPQLVVACEAIDAISRDRYTALHDLARAHRELLPALSARWCAPLTSAANLALRRIVTKLGERGARDYRQAVTRPELRPWLDTLRLLGTLGARAPKDAVGGAVELLQGADFAFMVEVGAEIRDEDHWRGLAALALETYARDAGGKHRILDVIDGHGVRLPDSPPMAVHRGRLDLLARHVDRDPTVLTRTFEHRQVYPPELACHDEHALALHGAPLDGATLLHMAVDYEDLEVARWLLDRGMDANARARIDADGFGGHTPLFNCVVTYNSGRGDEPLARLLLDRGANPNVRASIRKGLAFASDPSVHEYRDVTPLGWGLRFHEPSYVSKGALDLIRARGGHE